ncbi:MAG: hypothetical protein Q8S96_18160 [Hydrogenophaga sp.]|uniref:hypothetical protein n=1 Tax=Hydrogenophaga sp. TaxID=1904254 RepID=UPI00272052A1|nr:hypothetical protein [Hydrogenophaga sp.]MDO9480197.1 hypothetical protein [Hydrogenophaga sp.]MDP3346362.1 hypothetical protein [Hydrogenophaga sp.]MDP3805792.1 hypothetical protein [Hydrogenophaga sp.]
MAVNGSDEPVLRTPQTAAYVGALWGGVLALCALAWVFRSLSCLAVAAAVAVVAYPVWCLLVERAQLRRQAILQTVAEDQSTLVRWLWRGTLLQVGLVFVALLNAALLLGVLAQLSPWHWAVLWGDALVLGLVFHRVRRSLSQQIRAPYQGLVARMWPVMAGNVLLLMGAFVALDFYAEHLATPGPWGEVVQGAFEQGRSGVVCSVAGAWLGAVHAVDQLAWRVAISTLPTLPGMPMRLVGWVLFLAWTGVGAVLFSRFLLGVLAGVDARTVKPLRTAPLTAPMGSMWRSFVATIVALAVLSLFAAWKLAAWEPSSERGVSGVSVADDPCARVAVDTAGLRSALTDQIQQARLGAHRTADQHIDALLDTAFGRAEQGVDAYLGWYFSLYGDYSRLAAVMVGDLGQVMQENLTRHVFEDTGFQHIMASQSQVIQAAMAQQMLSVAPDLAQGVRATVAQAGCPVPSLNLDALADLGPDRIHAAVSTASAMTVGTVTAKMVAQKAVAAAAGKAAASGSLKLAAKLAAKAVAKPGAALAAGTAATAVCAPTGPAALLCGIAAGVVTWITVDKAAIEIEEHLKRDDMRADLMAVLNEQRATMRTELQVIYHGLADAYAAEIDARAQRVFVPARDGV